MTTFDSFILRLKKIGINVEVAANYPWVYLLSVNGVRVRKKYYSDYGFTLGWLPPRPNEEFRFSDISTIFQAIRDSLCKENVHP